jgi:molecular chaperone GrpE
MAEDLSDMQDATETQDQADGDDTLAALRSENAALKDQALRYAAEAENVRRRTEREANDARAYAIQKFARDLLDAADNLSRALQFAPKEAADPAVSNFVMGVEMTEKALQTAFERNGLKRVEPARGARFDPNLHQAMMEQAADDVAPGCVIMVMQTGYELFGRIVRPALVAVTPKATAAASGADGAGYGGQDRDVGASVDAKA